MNELSEKTRVPLFVVLSCVPIFVLVIFWMASIGEKTNASVERMDRQGLAITDMRVMFIEIRERLARIEENQKGRK